FQDLAGELAGLVVVGGPGDDLLAGELAGGLDERFLLFGEAKVHPDVLAYRNDSVYVPRAPGSACGGNCHACTERRMHAATPGLRGGVASCALLTLPAGATENRPVISPGSPPPPAHL